MNWKSLFAVLILISSCQDKISDFVGPCEFADANANFPEISNFRFGYDCEDCFINFEFMNQDYSFKESQFESGITGGVYSEEHNYLSSAYENAFFRFTVISPDKTEDLLNALNNRTPLLSQELLSNAELNDLPLISSSIFLKNYCKDQFHPEMTTDLDQSYHLVTSTELIGSTSYLLGANQDLFEEHFFIWNGEFKATFIINDQMESLIGTYRLRVNLFEKQ
jgi:hypothetical protein